jgi:hypothetical protein
MSDPDKREKQGSPSTTVVTKPRPKTKKPSMYKVLMLNDDYTPMEFVVHVLERFFGKNHEDAVRIMLHVHTGGDRQQTDRDGPCQVGSRLCGLKSLDDLARQRDRHLGAAGEQAAELGLVQPHQHRVPDRDHGRRPRLVGVQAHLADDLAARHLAHHVFDPVVVFDVGAQAPADRQVHRVAGIALFHQRFTGGDFHPLQVVPQKIQGVRVEVADKGLQVLFE